MASYREFFQRYFPLLSGHNEAFRWQEKLFERFSEGDIPASLNIPTGCGKTSVMTIWLLGLAYRAQYSSRNLLPRRLVWVVNRRVVVDQATDEAVSIARRLGESGPAELEPVVTALRALYGGPAGPPLGISTLRGQFADNAEWRHDPARPAIITGTVDMIGSRLLFSGYGCGFKSRPLHAGFLGQDTLLVHDEAHLEPAFQTLVEAIESEQRRAKDFRPLRTMQLTATARADANAFELCPEDIRDGEIAVRINARKGISLHSTPSEKDLVTEICRQALGFKDTGKAVLIFVRRLADVVSICSKLHKEGCQVQRLTGTLRGLERDRLIPEDPILARLIAGMPTAPQQGTVYLVSTSAGEVGVNLSADHAVCDLAPFDSMAQRLGRVNRFGLGDARVEVVHFPIPEEPSPFDEACGRTLQLLGELPARLDGRLDASPAALGRLDPEKRRAAFAPVPEILPTSGILFDAWSLTSIRGELPGRPPVADWLHGVETEPPQTFVAWRREVELLTEDLRQGYEPADLLEDFPLKPHELLRDASNRVVEQLEKIAAKVPEAPLWIIEANDDVRIVKLSDFASGGDRKRRTREIGNRTLVLPPGAGGLEKGFLAGDVPYSSSVDYDVSDNWTDENGIARRARVWDGEEAPAGMRLIRTLDLQFGRDDEDEDGGGPRYWRWYVRPRAADDDGSRSATIPLELEPHCRTAESYAVRLTEHLALSQTEAQALRLAAEWHDRGKNRDVWQRSIGNREFPHIVLAKSGGTVATIHRSRYRHEFGSLLEMGADGKLKDIRAEVQELAYHLVAAHHGRARPVFPDDEAFDTKYSDDIANGVAREIPARFIRLQKKYGRWGLAYLESLLRVADAWASQPETLAREAKA